jgi:formylglycine-generating enzyme required for sulfatase activity
VKTFYLMQQEVSVIQYKQYALRSGKVLPAAACFDSDYWNGGDLPRIYFSAAMKANYPAPLPRDLLPAVNVSWDRAAEYCADVGGRLPTEAEWESAARAGRSDAAYVWGDASLPSESGWPRANVWDKSVDELFGAPENHALWRACDKSPEYCNRCSLDLDDGFPLLAPVGPYKHPMQSENPWHLYDMAGNVWEWVRDTGEAKFQPGSYRGRPTDGSAYEEKDGYFHVYRGGAWFNGPWYVWTRSSGPRDGVSDELGFRCAADAAAVRRQNQ